jgi:Cof subfamily protein (haloacid dehalogenase superfamily)
VVRHGPRILRLAAIDLDGTLVRTDGTVSELTRTALVRVQAAGVKVVLASARGPRGVAEIARAHALVGTAICSNGAVLLDLERDEVLRTRHLGAEVAGRLVVALRKRLPGVTFAVESVEFAHEPGFGAWNWEPPAGTRIADALELLESPVAKLIVRHEEHDLAAIAAAAVEVVGSDAAVTIPGPWTVEVSAAGVSKATALAELCAELGIEATEVVGFGDYPNDVPMLRWAGHAVAVANAHPDVLAIADEVTASNDEDGVALVLERLV